MPTANSSVFICVLLISTPSFILQHVIRGNRPIKTEMAHQLYVLQVLTFNLLEERMMTKMDPNDQVTIRAEYDLIGCTRGHIPELLSSVTFAGDGA